MAKHEKSQESQESQEKKQWSWRKLADDSGWGLFAQGSSEPFVKAVRVVSRSGVVTYVGRTNFPGDDTIDTYASLLGPKGAFARLEQWMMIWVDDY